MYAPEATKALTGLPNFLTNCSEFKIHDDTRGKNVIDYFEQRLKRLLASTSEELHKDYLTLLLDDYLKGNVALAWHRCLPVYVCVLDEHGNSRSSLNTQAHR